MRIALFTETFLPKVDGIVNTLCYLLEYLEQEGHETILFAPNTAPKQYASTPIVHCPAYPLPFYPEFSVPFPYLNMSDELSRFQPDIVHVVSPFVLGIAGIRHARRLNVPVVASYHTDIPGFAEQWGFGALIVQPSWSIMRWIHNQADLNLCPSYATMHKLEEQSFERLKVWSRGVETKLFNPSQYSSEWRYKLTNGHPNDPLLIFVGRLSPEKRADWLRPVLDTYPNIRLAIVGDGPAREQLEELFADTQTVFTGYLRGEELAHAYASADLFMLPSAHETFGNVALEAMASGLPVIAAAAGGPLDFVKHGQNGLFFDPDSQADLIKKVGVLINDLDFVQELGQNARHSAEARSWTAVLGGLTDDYEAVLKAHQTKQPVSAFPFDIHTRF